MRAVLFRVVRRLRAAPLATALSVVLVALAVATVLALAAGAHRTATAPDRFVATTPLAYDALVTQGDGTPLTGAIAELPGVDAASSVTFVFGGLTTDGSDADPGALVFAGDPASQALQVID